MPAKKKSKRSPAVDTITVEEVKIEKEQESLVSQEDISYWQTVAKPQWERELKLLVAKPLPVAFYNIPDPVLPVSQERLEYELGVCKLIAPYIEGFQGTSTELMTKLDFKLDFELLQKDMRVLLRLAA